MATGSGLTSPIPEAAQCKQQAGAWAWRLRPCPGCGEADLEASAAEIPQPWVWRPHGGPASWVRVPEGRLRVQGEGSEVQGQGGRGARPGELWLLLKVRAEAGLGSVGSCH